MKKKKVLCLVQLAPPVHGASMMNGYLTGSKSVNDHFELEIINLQFTRSLKELKKFSFAKIFKAIGYIFQIVRKMTRFKPDLVFFTLSSKGYAFYRDALYVFIIKLYNARLIYHLHSKGINENAQRNFLTRTIYKWVFKNTECICSSEILGRDIENVSKTKPYIIPYGIPVTRTQGLERKKKNNKVPQILYLSNFIETKGILVFIEALSIIQKNGQVFNARLVGGPADVTMEILENKIRDKHLSSFTEVVGPLYNGKKYEEYEKADLFVFPTFYENEAFPLVLLEALQYNLPVISTFEGGIPDMILNNENGMLVEGRNPEMLASKMSGLINNPALREEMGEKAYIRFSNNYTLEHFEQNIIRTFNEVINKQQA